MKYPIPPKPKLESGGCARLVVYESWQLDSKGKVPEYKHGMDQQAFDRFISKKKKGKLNKTFYRKCKPYWQEYCGMPGLSKYGL